jgi:hypothetical protein
MAPPSPLPVEPDESTRTAESLSEDALESPAAPLLLSSLFAEPPSLSPTSRKLPPRMALQAIPERIMSDVAAMKMGLREDARLRQRPITTSR